MRKIIKECKHRLARAYIKNLNATPRESLFLANASLHWTFTHMNKWKIDPAEWTNEAISQWKKVYRKDLSPLCLAALFSIGYSFNEHRTRGEE